jgi:ATP-dependent DNA ligase
LPLDSELFTQIDKDPKWIAEVKKNGIRAMVYTYEGKQEIWTRNRTIVPDPLPEIRRQLLQLPQGLILDGELISKRPKNFEKHLYLFDIIMHEGKLVTSLPLSERRKLLEAVYHQYLQWERKIELSQWVQVGKKALYYQSIGNDLLEGIVVKRLDSKYLVHPNKCIQHPMWLKVKKPDTMFKSEGE